MKKKVSRGGKKIIIQGSKVGEKSRTIYKNKRTLVNHKKKKGDRGKRRQGRTKGRGRSSSVRKTNSRLCGPQGRDERQNHQGEIGLSPLGKKHAPRDFIKGATAQINKRKH